MSDRAPVNLIVHFCPPEQEQAILKFINEHGLTEDYFGGGDEMELKLHTVYGSDDEPLDEYAEIATALSELVPHAAFEVWSDPKYEYPGGVTFWTLELGFFNGTCDANGEPYLTAHEYMKGLTPDQVFAKLGIAWEQKFQEYRNGG